MKNKPIHMVKTITNEKLNKYAWEWKHNEDKIEALCIAQNDENWKHIENEIEVLCMAQDEINKYSIRSIKVKF